MTWSEKLTVTETPNKGRGVFALKDFAEGELIESCPVIALPAHDRVVVDTTPLYNYYFSWGPDLTGAALCLGLESLYNHSYTPNPKYIKDFARQQIDFVALRAISAGEEIAVNYNGDPSSLKPLWFDPVF